MRPTVSIVIPMYNGSTTIRRAMTSVIEQSFSDWELLVVDDVSTDDSREVVRTFIAETGDERIRLIERAANGGGPGPGRNTGFDHSQGELITFLDCDDEFLPGFLETHCALMEDPELDVAMGAHVARTIDGREVIRPDRVRGELSGAAAVNAILQDRMWNYTHAKLYRRGILDVVRNREETLRYEDLVFNACVFSYARKVHVTHHPSLLYYIAANSVTWSQEPTLDFAISSQECIRTGLNPAIRDQVETKSWVALKVTLFTVTLSNALAMATAASYPSRLVKDFRKSVTVGEALATVPVLPLIGVSALVARMAPGLYGKLYRLYVKRNYAIEA